MRIVVFGAAGRTGRLIAEKALGHGQDVIAFQHSTPLALSAPRLTSISGDVRDFSSVSRAVELADAVAFALSQGATGGRDIHDAGIANVIHAMAEHDVRKLAAVSAAGTFDRSSKRLAMTYRATVALTMRAVYDDLEAMERRIMASDLDWTIVRPYGLSDGAATGDYRISLDGSLLAKASRISRADVAAVVVKALETDTYRRRAIVIAE
jgi:putative NADH-flavin reductase